ncbi:ATP-dependent DNA helicase PIF1 isoform X1 [Heterocephalus glaber]|uniref:ATP-dependent DNA helicase n=1 Tax=Heterocephalus glaber TaxID=10181 RepID=A0AAX6R623_HETGA|nr:ATP-dependent DNA helicase PIF1 isoform X1 [Heterocephalus glaber]
MLAGTEEAAAKPEDAELRCRVAVEELSPGGQPRRREALRSAELSLGRNERRELVLRLRAAGPAGRSRCFPLRAARLFTRFATTGRSALRLSNPGAPRAGATQLLLSDCPPERLRRFLRTLRLKLAAAPGPAPASARAQLLGPRPSDFVSVSPVQPEELRRAAATRASKKPLTEQPAPAEASTEPPRWPLPAKRLSLPPSKPQLSEEQAAVLRVVLKGQSVFFTGSAGTGKSYLLKRILGSLPPTGTVATASTGVAACHIGGTTLHAFAGIGSGQAPLAQCVALAQRPGVRQGWLSCRRLVIDEISMVEADLFDKLEAVARAVRQQDKPFGGIQLIICGDFLQLPPVTKGSQPPRFCFQAKSWRKCVPVTLELTEVWRQADTAFISLLQAVRLGRCSDEVTRQLRATAAHKVGRDGIVATRLCTHQDDVALTNERRLQELPGEVHSFKALDSHPELARTLDAQCPVSWLLQLKLGAQYWGSNPGPACSPSGHGSHTRAGLGGEGSLKGQGGTGPSTAVTSRKLASGFSPASGPVGLCRGPSGAWNSSARQPSQATCRPPLSPSSAEGQTHVVSLQRLRVHPVHDRYWKYAKTSSAYVFNKYLCIMCTGPGSGLAPGIGQKFLPLF